MSDTLPLEYNCNKCGRPMHQFGICAICRRASDELPFVPIRQYRPHSRHLAIINFGAFVAMKVGSMSDEATLTIGELGRYILEYIGGEQELKRIEEWAATQSQLRDARSGGTDEDR